MPSGLLDSQFAALEEPEEDEHAIVIDIEASVDQVVDHIIDSL